MSNLLPFCVSYPQFLTRDQLIHFLKWRIFWKFNGFRVLISDLFFQLFLQYFSAGKGLGMGSETAEKKQSNMNELKKKKTNYKRADLYCVRISYCQHSGSVFIFSTFGLLSDFLFISGTHVLRRFSFRNLVFWYSISDTPPLKISLVSWLDWSPAAGKARPQQGI